MIRIFCKGTLRAFRFATIALSIVVFTFLSLFIGCSKSTDHSTTDSQEQIRRVDVMVAQITPRAERFLVSGRVIHEQEALLSFKTGGFTEAIHVEEGEQFRQGDVLAILDTTEIAAVVTDAVQLREMVERDANRLRRLYEEGAVTLQQYQEAQTGLERALAAERRAMFNLQRSLILAPFDGVVAQRFANEGELRDAGMPILRVVSTGADLRVKVGAPSRFARLMDIHDVVNVQVEDLPEVFQARIVEKAAVTEPATGNVLLEIALPSDDRILEGMIARVTFHGPLHDSIVLPSGALAQGDEDFGVVYVVDENRVLRRELQLRYVEGDSIVFYPDLPPGSFVVQSGAALLRDGEQVRVVENPS